MAAKLFVIFLEMGAAGSAAGGLFLFLRERLHRRYMARTLCMVWMVLALWLVLPLQSFLPASIQIELPPASVEQTASAQNGTAEPEATQVTKTVETPGAASQGQTARGGELPLPTLSTLLSLLTIVWLAGVVLYGAGQIAAYRQFLSALRAGVLPEPAELQSLFETQLERLGVRRTVALGQP